MNPATLLKKPIVLIVIGVLLAMLFLPFISAGSLTESVDEKIRGFWTRNELTETAYAVSWKSNGMSEAITANAYTKRVDVLITHRAYGVRFLYYIGSDLQKTDPISGFFSFPPTYSWDGGSWESAASSTIRLTGPRTGELKVVTEWDFRNIVTGTSETRVGGKDGAYLKSGEGIVQLDPSKPGPFEEGGKATLYVQTGYTGMTNGWELRLYAPVGRTDLWSGAKVLKTMGDDARTYVEVPIEAGWFKAGDPNINKFRAELWNYLFMSGFEDFFSVDFLDRIPQIKEIVVVNNEVSMSYTIYGNRTYADLSGVIVYAWYSYQLGGTTKPPLSDTQSWILYDARYPFSANNMASFDVIPKNFDGIIVVQAYAYDVDGRVSEVYTTSVKVEDGKTTPGPSPDDSRFVWTLTAIIIAVIMILLVIAIIMFAPVPIEIKALLAMIVGIAGAALVWLAGTLQLGV